MKIIKIEWDDPSLVIIGDNWGFATVSSWRIINAKGLICGCYDKNAEDEIQKLKELKIIGVEVQSNHLIVDPVFEFCNESTKCKLEIFSTTYLEPWIFDLSPEMVYVSSPSDLQDG